MAQLSANQTLMQAQQALINKLLNESCYGQQVRVDKLLKETCCEQLQPQEYSTKVITPVNNNEEEDWFLKGGRLAYVGSIFADIYKVEEIHETLKNKIINKLIDFLKKL